MMSRPAGQHAKLEIDKNKVKSEMWINFSETVPRCSGEQASGRDSFFIQVLSSMNGPIEE